MTRTGTEAWAAACSAWLRRYDGLDSDQLVDAGRIVLEVDAVAGADLDHPALRSGEQFAAQLALALAAVASAVAVKDAREDRVVNLLTHV